MDGFLVSAAIFGIVALAALAVIVRAIINFIREGSGANEEQVSAAKPESKPVTKPVMASPPQRPVRKSVKPASATAPSSQPAANTPPKEVVKTEEPAVVAVERTEVGETAKVDVATPAVEPAETAEANVTVAVEGEAVASAVAENGEKAETAEVAVEQESKYPPVKPQGPNGESEKRVAEIQDIIKKYV